MIMSKEKKAETEISGRFKVFEKASLGQFIIKAIEVEYKVKLSHFDCNFCYKGSYSSVRRIALASCDDGVEK